MVVAHFANIASLQATHSPQSLMQTHARSEPGLHSLGASLLLLLFLFSLVVGVLLSIHESVHILYSMLPNGFTQSQSPGSNPQDRCDIVPAAWLTEITLHWPLTTAYQTGQPCLRLKTFVMVFLVWNITPPRALCFPPSPWSCDYTSLHQWSILITCLIE